MPSKFNGGGRYGLRLCSSNQYCCIGKVERNVIGLNILINRRTVSSYVKTLLRVSKVVR